MAKKFTIQDAVEEFELYDLYKDIIESYGKNLEDPSFVSDIYDLIDEYDEEIEFWPDSEGDFSESFKRNLKEVIITIVEESEDLVFIDDSYSNDDDIPEIYDDDFEKGSKAFGMELGEEEELDDFS